MDSSWISPTVLISVLGIVATIALSFGVERQARMNLEERHAKIAEEARGYGSNIRAAEEKIAVQANEIARLSERVENLRSQLASKASVDAVDSLREAIGRIDGKLDALTMTFGQRRRRSDNDDQGG